MKYSNVSIYMLRCVHVFVCFVCFMPAAAEAVSCVVLLETGLTPLAIDKHN